MKKNPYPCYVCNPPHDVDPETMKELQDNKLHTCNRKAYAEGQQNPDPKQYANREELVEAIRERQILGEITFPEIENIIRTHGKEE